MGQSYVGEIRLWPGMFAPAGWRFCDGSLLSISEYDTLYNLVGVTYGGDGSTTFAIPDLRGRVPIHTGQGGGLQPYSIGAQGGSETVTLTGQQLPSHNHAFNASTAGTQGSPAGANLGSPGNGFDMYIVNTPTVAMAGTSISTAGASLPHENMMPFLCVNFIISLFGVYPSQN